MQYREVLNFPNNYPFGIEIEVCNKNVEDIDKMLKNHHNISICSKDYFALMSRFGEEYANLIRYTSHFVFKNNFDAHWLYKHEDTNEFDSSLGAEVISPILYNQKSDLRNLKSVLTMLEENGAEVNENCGVHIHIGAKPFSGSYQKLLNFFLFYLLFEPVFYKLSAMGNFGHVREYAISYANPIVLKMKKAKMNQAILEEYIKTHSKGEKKEDGLHFKSFNMNQVRYGSSFEIRTFNGSLDPFVIENYINVSLASVFYCVQDCFDQKVFSKRCSNAIKERKDWLSFSQYVDYADNLVEEFIECIFPYQEDKDYFYRQYSGEYLKRVKNKEHF